MATQAWRPDGEETSYQASSKLYHPGHGGAAFGAIIGAIGCHPIDWANRHCSIGYWIDAGDQRKGLVTRCCASMLDYLFDNVGLHRVEIRCGTANTRSCAIPQRLGFTREGVCFQADWVGYSSFPASLPDGTSNTILFTEVYAGGTYQSSDQSLWWWDYNSFMTTQASNGDCGSLNFGSALSWNGSPCKTCVPPMIQPSPQTCKSSTTSRKFTP